MFNINVKRVSQDLLLYVVILFILFLTAINLDNFLTPKKVLGAASNEKVNEQEFWESFLDKNPNYIPGFIETKQMDKANKIDPNYITP